MADEFMEKAGRIIFCDQFGTFFSVFSTGELGNMRGLSSKGEARSDFSGFVTHNRGVGRYGL